MKPHLSILVFRYVLLFILASTYIGINAQDMTLETQADVDAFDPSITVLQGSLIIGVNIGTSNIVDLSSLSNLSNIEGSLVLTGNDLLLSLMGLERGIQK